MHGAIQGSRDNPAFPAQWFDGLCRALPGAEFLLASVTSVKFTASAPVDADDAFAKAWP